MTLLLASLAVLLPLQARAAQVGTLPAGAKPGAIAPQLGLPGIPSLPATLVPGLGVELAPTVLEAGVAAPMTGLSLQPSVAILPSALPAALPAPRPAALPVALQVLGKALAPALETASRPGAASEASAGAGSDIEVLLQGGQTLSRPSLELAGPALSVPAPTLAPSVRSAARRPAPAVARPPRRLVPIDRARAGRWLAAAGLGALTLAQASGLVELSPDLASLGFLGLYGGLMMVPDRLPDPAEVFPRAFKEAAKLAAERGYPADQVFFGEAAASMPVRQGNSWNFTFYLGRSAESPLDQLVVSFDRGPTGTGAFYTNHSLYRGAPVAPGLTPVAPAAFDAEKGALMTPDRALDLARLNIAGMSPRASVSLRAEGEGLAYRFYDDDGAAAAVDARTGATQILSLPRRTLTVGEKVADSLRVLWAMGTFLGAVLAFMGAFLLAGVLVVRLLDWLLSFLF